MVYFQKSVGPGIDSSRVHAAEVAVVLWVLSEEHLPHNTVVLYGDMGASYTTSFLDGVIEPCFPNRIQYSVLVIGLDVRVCHYA